MIEATPERVAAAGTTIARACLAATLDSGARAMIEALTETFLRCLVGFYGERVAAALCHDAAEHAVGEMAREMLDVMPPEGRA